jgi:hypothetical protein
MGIRTVVHPVIRWSRSLASSVGRPSSRREAFSPAILAFRSSISSCWSSQVLSMSGRAMTARCAFCILSLISVAAVATCWISSGPSAEGWEVVVGVGDVSSSRFRSLWRSGRTSKVDGGGRPGAETAACTAGVAQAVGGIEARAEAGAWGVAAADMVVSRLWRQWRREEKCGRVCCLARRADQVEGCRLALYDCNTRVPADAWSTVGCQSDHPIMRGFSTLRSISAAGSGCSWGGGQRDC